MREKEAAPGIKFHYLEPARFPVRAVRKVLGRVFRKYGREPIAVSYVFCSDAYLLEINKSYLGRNYFTDIITFDLSDSKAVLQADIYISVERVKENADSLGLPRYKELVRVILHGALHLVGFSDKSEVNIKLMRAAEEKFLVQVLENVPRETKDKKKFHVKHRKRVS